MIKKAFPDCELIAGKCCNRGRCKDLIRAGVDAIKVGVGSGSICITRVITGSGVPRAHSSPRQYKGSKRRKCPSHL